MGTNITTTELVESHDRGSADYNARRAEADPSLSRTAQLREAQGLSPQVDPSELQTPPPGGQTSTPPRVAGS